MLESLLQNKAALKATVVTDGVEVSPAILASVVSEDVFWKNVSNLAALLKPIYRGVTVLESDTATLSLVVRVFMDIKTVFFDVLSKMSIRARTRKTLLERLKDRIEYCVQPIHLAAYVVEPRFLGDGLSDEEFLKATDVILSLARHLDLDEDSVLTSLTEYKCQSGIYGQALLKSAAKRIDCKPVEWWKAFCPQQKLFPVAIRLLSLAPTSAPCERSWSDFGNVHTKKRNRLKARKTMKLVSVQKHLRCSNTKLREKAAKRSHGGNCDYYRTIDAVSLEVDTGVESESDDDNEQEEEIGMPSIEFDDEDWVPDDGSLSDGSDSESESEWGDSD